MSKARFLLLLALLAGFIWFSCTDLPPLVASHFGASGMVDGYMPRTAYRGLLLLIGVGAPLVVELLPAALIRSNPERINIPDRDYWLAPARRQQTLAFICNHGRWLAAGMAIFLAYVHWQVVLANRVSPARLALTKINFGLVFLLLALLVWVWRLFTYFRRSR